jgi:glycosyltransferase involved in cell wall biosynthesis
MNKKLNVLVIAESANPDWTSVPLLGWSHAMALSRICNVHLVTQIRNREAILRAGLKEGQDFSVVDTEFIDKPFYKLGILLRGGDKLAWTITTALQSITYPFFERLCWKKFKPQLSEGKFDLVHRITPLSPTAPSYLAKKLHKLNIPYVVGPLNGGVSWPSHFSDVRRKEREWLSKVRFLYRLLPGYKALRKYSSAIIVASRATEKQMPDYCKDKIFYIPENAIDPERFPIAPIENKISDKPIKACFVGRLVPYKGVDMAISAISKFAQRGQITFDIYGDGPEKENLLLLIKRLGLTKSVRLSGFVDNKDLHEFMSSCQLFIFPSVREFGGGAVLEAMALGLVPVIVDYAGPSELVSSREGFKVAIKEKSQVISEIEALIEDIVNNPMQLQSKRKAAIEKVSELYTWDKKAKQVLSIYQWVISKNIKKPKSVFD